MKKFISVLILLALAATGAFAQISVGGGFLFDLSTNNGFEYTVTVPFTNLKRDYYDGNDITSYGGFAFLDVSFAELGVSFAYGDPTRVSIIDGDKTTIESDGGSLTQLGLSALGKFPVKVGPLTVFPLLGVNYNMVLSIKNDNGDSVDDPGDWSQFGILGGIGVDFFFTSNLFLRAEALCNLRFPSKAAKDMADAVPLVEPDTTLGIGPQLKVGLGFRL